MQPSTAENTLLESVCWRANMFLVYFVIIIFLGFSVLCQLWWESEYLICGILITLLSMAVIFLSSIIFIFCYLVSLLIWIIQWFEILNGSLTFIWRHRPDISCSCTLKLTSNTLARRSHCSRRRNSWRQCNNSFEHRFDHLSSSPRVTHISWRQFQPCSTRILNIQPLLATPLFRHPRDVTLAQKLGAPFVPPPPVTSLVLTADLRRVRKGPEKT